MPFKKRLNHIYVIDANMFDFAEYMSCYLVQGKALALVDTGLPNQLDAVLAGIEEHGFAVEDIAYIFITHCEHPDHAGNIAPVLEMAPKAKVCINPIGLDNLLDPSIQDRARKASLPEKMYKRFGTTKPVARDRIVLLEDETVMDLGAGVRLTFRFTKAHQPSGYIIFDQKNQGLFISDLGGNYFDDCGYHLNLHPPDSDFFTEYEDLKKLIQMPIRYLYLGHYGILDDAPRHLHRALKRMEEMIDIGKRCLADGQREKIAEIIHNRNQEEAKKLLKTRSRELYEYAINEHIPPQAKNFAKLFLNQYDH